MVFWVGDILSTPSLDDVFWGAWSTLTCARHQRRTPRDALAPRAARCSPALPWLAFQPPAPSPLLEVISPQSRDRFFPRYPTRPCLFYPGSLLWMCWTWSNPLENGDQLTFTRGLLEESQQQKEERRKSFAWREEMLSLCTLSLKREHVSKNTSVSQYPFLLLSHSNDKHPPLPSI